VVKFWVFYFFNFLLLLFFWDVLCHPVILSIRFLPVISWSLIWSACRWKCQISQLVWELCVFWRLSFEKYWLSWYIISPINYVVHGKIKEVEEWNCCANKRWKRFISLKVQAQCHSLPLMLSSFCCFCYVFLLKLVMLCNCIILFENSFCVLLPSPMADFFWFWTG